MYIALHTKLKPDMETVHTLMIVGTMRYKGWWGGFLHSVYIGLEHGP